MSQIQVSVVMGSSSDDIVMKETCAILKQLSICYEKRVVSAHRMPLEMVAYAQEAKERGIQVIIAGAGGAAHLPGMIASLTLLPVIGVPIQSKALSGMDSLLSIVQMPFGVSVNTMAIGLAGAKNAALAAARIIALQDPAVELNLQIFSETMHRQAMESEISE